MNNDGVYGLTEKGITLMCELTHGKGVMDCACMHTKPKWYERCFNCKERKICKDNVQRSKSLGVSEETAKDFEASRGSFECRYIKYHHERSDEKFDNNFKEVRHSW